MYLAKQSGRNRVDVAGADEVADAQSA